MAEPLLSVEDLRTYFHTGSAVAKSVDGVSFTVAPGETLGIVGESGCGKSVTALSILRLIQQPGRIERGSKIMFEGNDLVTVDDAAMREIRGNRISMIFQEPMSALNPVFTVGDQVAEVARIHGTGSRQEAWDRAVEMLSLTGIPDPEERAKNYPHQLSGGMRQRVLIAMALMMNPALVIADEPTTALDVTIQAQILELLVDLQKKFGTSILMITHDLGVIAETASRVVVMYCGEVVEEADVTTLFDSAHHPYTEGLMHAMPRLGQPRERLNVIPGSVPAPPIGRRAAGFANDAPTRGSCARPSIHHSIKSRSPILHAVTLQSSPSGERIRIHRSLNSSVSPPDVIIAELGHGNGRSHSHGGTNARGERRGTVAVRSQSGQELSGQARNSCSHERRDSRGQRRVVRHRERRNAEPRRRIRLREDNHRSLHPPADRADLGTINFSGHDVRRLGVAGLREVRREMQIIFQDPVSSLNPRMTVGAAIREGITIHRLAEGAAADAIVQRLLEEVDSAVSMPRVTRTSSRAGSASASASRERSPSSRGSSCATSLYLRSTFQFRRR
jgi:oligopeptide/dipeptide ABC transporter ATP-binding protein